MAEEKRVPELRFPEFSGEWESTYIKNEFDFHNNKRRPVTFSKRKKGIYPYYGSTGVIDYVDKYIFDGEYLLIGEDGANIISRTLPFVYHINGKAWINNHAHVLQPENKQFNFYKFLLDKINYIPYNTGTAQPKLNIESLKNIPIYIPDDFEQHKIGEFFSKLDRQIELEEKKLALLEEQKKGYMQKIFSQELRFKDENGEDYPEWGTYTLNNLFDIKKGTGLSKELVSFEGKNNCILYGELFTTYKEIITKIASKTNSTDGVLIKDPCIIFPNSTTTKAKDLVTFSSVKKTNIYIGGDITILSARNKELVNNDFFAYYLSNNKDIVREISKYGQGITIVHLTFTNFKNVIIRIPSYKEQLSISLYLIKIDKYIELRSKRIETFKIRKKELLNKVVI